VVDRRTLTGPKNLQEEDMSDPGCPLNQASCMIRKRVTPPWRVETDDGSDGGLLLSCFEVEREAQGSAWTRLRRDQGAYQSRTYRLRDLDASVVLEAC
jgi:hypothetical protein